MKNRINYLLFFMLLVSVQSIAQLNITGLGNYTLGLTTPDSLSPADFREQEPPLVKGTLALTCRQVRIFTSGGRVIAGRLTGNLTLAFYDNRLFRIVCDYNDTLRRDFTKQFGSVVRKPASYIRVCTQGTDKRLAMWGDAWLDTDAVAFVVYRQGYTIECRQEERATLVIWQRTIAALCSECDLPPTDPLLEAYIHEQLEK